MKSPIQVSVECAAFVLFDFNSCKWMLQQLVSSLLRNDVGLSYVLILTDKKLRLSRLATDISDEHNYLPGSLFHNNNNSNNKMCQLVLRSLFACCIAIAPQPINDPNSQPH